MLSFFYKTASCIYKWMRHLLLVTVLWFRDSTAWMNGSCIVAERRLMRARCILKYLYSIARPVTNSNRTCFIHVTVSFTTFKMHRGWFYTTRSFPLCSEIKTKSLVYYTHNKYKEKSSLSKVSVRVTYNVRMNQENRTKWFIEFKKSHSFSSYLLIVRKCGN